MRKLAIMLCLILLVVSEATAIQVTPGGLTIHGQVYVTGDPMWDPDQEIFVPVDGWYDFAIPTEAWSQESGDPQDLMYCSSTEIGVRAGVFNVPLGTFENGSIVCLGHLFHVFDLVVQPNTSEAWSGSQNLLIELRSPIQGVDTVYWSAAGPFSQEPLHVYLEFPNGIPGYEVRLTAVPEASSLANLFSGLGLLMLGRRIRRA